MKFCRYKCCCLVLGDLRVYERPQLTCLTEILNKGKMMHQLIFHKKMLKFTILLKFSDKETKYSRLLVEQIFYAEFHYSFVFYLQIT